MTNPIAPATPRPPSPTPPSTPANSAQNKGTGRGRKPGTPAKERPAIPSDMFVIEEVAEENRGQFKRRREERTEDQVRVDNTVMDVFKKWQAAGGPRAWGRCPVFVWALPKDLVETAEFLLGKAAMLHGVKIFYGQKGIIKDNKYQLSFTVVSRKIKEIEGQPKQ